MQSPITRKKLSDEVRNRIEEMIRSERYPVGSALPSERELMAMFDVGRPSIREALYSLETMGLVRIASGERPRVTRPTPRGMIEQLSGTARLLLEQPEGVDHFEQLRLFLEIGIVRHAAEFATDEQLVPLRRALEENRLTIPKANAFAHTDVAFHRVLMGIPQNPIFIAVHEALVDWLISQRIHRANTEAENLRSYDGHRLIVEAIERRDPEAASAAMRDHLLFARRKYALELSALTPTEE
jgi:GntR family transcriptional regulator, sialic acid-inducible nan operon repressor